MPSCMTVVCAIHQKSVSCAMDLSSVGRDSGMKVEKCFQGLMQPGRAMRDESVPIVASV